jgi:hypothetical protein
MAEVANIVKNKEISKAVKNFSIHKQEIEHAGIMVSLG